MLGYLHAEVNCICVNYRIANNVCLHVKHSELAGMNAGTVMLISFITSNRIVHARIISPFVA